MTGHDTADLGDVRLHYAWSGKKDARRLILFAHGFPEFWYVWRRQLEYFGEDFLAVAPDMRGYNLSSKPEGVASYGIDKLVGDLVGLARHLGHEKFVLVAHDWGGGVAWSTALRHPDKVERLVIVNCPHPVTFERELTTNPVQQKASQYTLLFQTPQAEALLEANGYDALSKLFLKKGLETGLFTEADSRAYIEAWSQPGALTGSLNYYRAARLGPAMKPGGRVGSFENNIADPVVRVPTLVLWGEKDTALVVENLNGLEAYVPDLKVVRVPDGTHWLIHEQPDLINREIRAFVGAA